MRGSPRPPCCMRLALSAGPRSSAFMHMLWQFSWLLTSSAIILSLSWKTLSMAQGGETSTGSSQDTPRDDCEDSPRRSDLIASLLPTIRSLVQEGIQLSLSSPVFYQPFVPWSRKGYNCHSPRYQAHHRAHLPTPQYLCQVSSLVGHCIVIYVKCQL